MVKYCTSTYYCNAVFLDKKGTSDGTENTNHMEKKINKTSNHKNDPTKLTETCSELNTSTCNAKTCLYYCNVSFLEKKGLFDNAKKIIQMKKREINLFFVILPIIKVIQIKPLKHVLK